MRPARRHTIACVLVAALTAAAAAPAVAQQSPAGQSDKLRVFQGFGAERAGGGIELLPSSGDALIDRLMAIEMLAIQSRFHVAPRFFYFDDGANHNAFWTPRTFGKSIVQAERRQFGSVAFGKNLLAGELRSTPSTGRKNTTIAAILAHECGHMLQYDKRSRLSPAQNELQADFLAGWSTRCEKRHGNPDLDEGHVFVAFYKLGDEGIYNIQHHGLKKERCAAFLAGFDVEHDDVEVAYVQGAEYVKNFKFEPRPPLSAQFHPYEWPDENGYAKSEPTITPSVEYYSRRLDIYFQAIRLPGGAFGMALSRFPNDASPAGRCGLEKGGLSSWNSTRSP